MSTRSLRPAARNVLWLCVAIIVVEWGVLFLANRGGPGSSTNETSRDAAIMVARSLIDVPTIDREQAELMGFGEALDVLGGGPQGVAHQLGRDDEVWLVRLHGQGVTECSYWPTDNCDSETEYPGVKVLVSAADGQVLGRGPLKE